MAQTTVCLLVAQLLAYNHFEFASAFNHMIQNTNPLNCRKCAMISSAKTQFFKAQQFSRLAARCRTSQLVMMARTLPRDVKDTINQLRESMQAGLSARCSRMDIELPFAVNLGVEKSAKVRRQDSFPILCSKVC